MVLNVLKLNSSESFLLRQIVKKNFSSKYKDSVLGIFWSVLRPLLYMVMMTVIFSAIFNRINNFAVYFLSGYALYQFFVSATTVSMNSLKNNKAILEKVNVSSHIFIIGSIFSEFLNFLITLVLLAIIMIITKCSFYPTIIYGIVPIILLTIVIIGSSLILAILRSYFSDIAHLYSVFSIFLMYASAVFVPMESIPAWASKYFELNPLYQCIYQFREAVLYGHSLPIQSVCYTLICGLILLIIGFLIFKRYQDKVIYRL